MVQALQHQQAGYSSVGRASDCRNDADIRWFLVRFRVAGLELFKFERPPSASSYPDVELGPATSSIEGAWSIDAQLQGLRRA